MDINELVPGKLYMCQICGNTQHWIFIKRETPNSTCFRAHYFSDKRLMGENYFIGNTEFYGKGKEVSYDEVRDWMPEKFMPKITNYEIY